MLLEVLGFAKDFELSLPSRDFTGQRASFSRTLKLRNETLLSLHLPLHTRRVKVDFEDSFCLHLFFFASLEGEPRLSYFPLHGLYLFEHSGASLADLKRFLEHYSPPGKSGSQEVHFSGSEWSSKEFFFHVFCPFSSVGNQAPTSLSLEVEVGAPASALEEFQKEDPSDTLEALYSSPDFGSSVLETVPRLPEPSSAEPVSLTLFADPLQTVSLVSFEVKRTPLTLKANREVVFTLISRFTAASGERVAEYLEKNEQAKQLDRQVLAQEFDQQVSLLLFRPDPQTAGRALQSQDQVVLELQFLPTPQSAPDDNGSGGDSSEGGENQSAPGGASSEGQGTPEFGAGSADAAKGGTEGGSGDSFDYSILGIVLGALAFLILVSSILAALVNQKRKNRILKNRIRRTSSLNASEDSGWEVENPNKSSKIKFGAKQQRRLAEHTR